MDADLSAIKRLAQWCIFRSGWWAWDWDLSWVALTYIGALQFEKEAVQKWSKPVFEAYCAGAWLLFWTDATLYWAAKPTVHKETGPNLRRLHNDTGPALECDIENLYFIHGVMVPAFVVVKPEWITVKHIETEDNAEVRRIMIERYGQAKYLVDSGAQEIHRDDFGILYRQEIPNDEAMVMVKVVNSTPEPDGSFKDYFIRVPPMIQRAREAVAWTFGKKEDEYAPCVET